MDEIGFSPYLKRISSVPLLSRDEELRLARAVVKGDKRAREKMVNSNVRLAINYAKKYNYSGLPFEDLVSECIIGLHRAVDRFDPELGWRFSTYATWWVRQAVQRYVHVNSEMIRVPSQIVDRRYKIAQALRKVPNLTDEELADELGLTLEQVEEAWHGPGRTISLDSLLTEDGGSFHDVIEDHFADDPSEVKEDLGQLNNALRTLTPIERRVVELRWGTGEGTANSRNEVADILGLSPSAVRDAQTAALEKLKRFLGDTPPPSVE